MENETRLQLLLQANLKLWEAAKKAQASQEKPRVEFAIMADSQGAKLLKTIHAPEGRIVCQISLDSNEYGEFKTFQSDEWPKPFILNGWMISNSYILEEYK